MFPLAQKHEKARQIWAEAWASANRDVDLVGGEGRRGGVVTCSSLFLCHIRLAGGCNVSPSPTDVSPTENSWMLHPLNKMSLAIFPLTEPSHP
jgi:hypothetical protein